MFELLDRTQPHSVQFHAEHYSLAYREEEEREMFPTLKHFGVGSIPWSPLARGTLTRPLSQQTKRSETDRLIKNYKGGDIVNRSYNKPISNTHSVEELAKKRGISMAQVSLAWVMNRPGVTAPIIGTTSLDNLKQLLGEWNLVYVALLRPFNFDHGNTAAEAIDIILTDEEMKYLEEPYQPQGIIGHS
ncbi:hypothetical protein D9758_010284 [Tetrapyrgos nigripes]|uniref:NADP-dependent oxidoreductase domain-containing protein n=1 Tax=Tetrapyrgos nigripes TaxID=182062 RepID=A0A8H5GAE7_9AGAR|nr:hypothetical protein D9758_010284 [Tetrapyrgos nigripes]